MVKKKIKFTAEQKKRLGRVEVVLTCLVFISLVFPFIALHHIENYSDWAWLLLFVGATSLLIALIIYQILCYFIPESRLYKNAKGVGFNSHIYFSVTLLGLGVGGIINEQWPRSQECNTYKIVSIDRSNSNKAHYIFIKKGNSKERLLFGPSFNRAHYEGEYIQLSLITGFLGFKYYKVKCQ